MASQVGTQDRYRACHLIAGDLADVEAMTSLKDLMAALGSENLDCRQDGTALDASVRAGYTFNSTIAGIEDADALLLVGTNPRLESPIINARIRKRYLKEHERRRENRKAS